jgi:hypothetical protein
MGNEVCRLVESIESSSERARGDVWGAIEWGAGQKRDYLRYCCSTWPSSDLCWLSVTQRLRGAGRKRGYRYLGRIPTWVRACVRVIISRSVLSISGFGWWAITPFDQLNINKSEAFIIPVNKYLISSEVSGCLIILSNKLVAVWPVPSAGRRRSSSAPRPDPTERSLLALTPPVINYPIPFMILFRPILI